MRKTYLLLTLLFLTGCGVNVNKICKDSGYFVYERVNLPPEYIKAYAPGMDKKDYEYRFGINENYYIDKDKLEEDYTFVFRKWEDLEGYETWSSITDSIVRKSDGKILAKQVAYIGYKADDTPFLYPLGHSSPDTFCPNGNVGYKQRASIFNSSSIVKDVFMNKDYTWTPESLLGSESIRSGKFDDLCANTGIKIYERELIGDNHLLPIKEIDKHSIQGYYRYINSQKYYFDIEKLQKDYVFTYRDNQLLPSTKNTRVVRSTIVRKRDNKLIAEAISVHGRESDSYTGTTGDLNCSQLKTHYQRWNVDTHDRLLRSVFFKDDIDYQMFKLFNERAGDRVISSTTYDSLISNEEEMDFNQRLWFYKSFFRRTYTKEEFKIQDGKLISLYKNPLIDESNIDVDRLIVIYQDLVELALKYEDDEYIELYGNKLMSIYEGTLQNKDKMDFDQLVITYRTLVYLSAKIDDIRNLGIYSNKLLSLIKGNSKYSGLYRHIKRKY